MARDDLLAELLYQAVALEGAAREEFARDVEQQDPELGRELRSLLPHADATDARLKPRRTSVPAEGAVDDPLIGSSIGPYTIERLIGRGGMGRVYLATQSEPIRRTVAIKVIHPGMDSEAVLRRFRNERRSLEQLQHPNVARVLDAGSDDGGRPYLVMELADGPTLTEYCETHDASEDAWAPIFLQACEGVAHAHARGILHRDLKPSNVLVVQEGGQPVAKVIDFGVATILDATSDGSLSFEQTATDLRARPIGTLGWMSPEQLLGEPVDARSDVYSLGVVLYRLIAGRAPWTGMEWAEASPEERGRRLRESVPTAPSRRSSSTRGSSTGSRGLRELDWICLRAMAPEPTRRYPDVRGLIRDLERYAAGQPVSAGPSSIAYRARKYAQRHRGPLSALALVVVVSSAIIWVLQDSNTRIRAAQARTSRALGEVQIAVDHLAQVLSSENPHMSGPETTVRDMVLGSLESLDLDTRGSERVRAWVRPVLASALMTLDEREVADRELAIAEQEVRDVFGETSPEMAHLYVRMAALRDHQQRMDEMDAMATRALDVLDRLEDPDPRIVVRAMGFRGSSRSRLGGDVELGNRLLDEAIDYAREHGLEDSGFGVRLVVWRAGGLRLSGDHEQAERILEGLAERVRRIDDPRRWQMLSDVLVELGALLIDGRRSAEARTVLEEAIATRTEHLGADAMRTLDARESLAIALLMTGDRDGALREFGDVAAGIEAVLGPQAGRVLSLKANRLGLLIGLGRTATILDEAPALIEDLGAVHGSDSIQTAQAMAILGKAHLMEGRPAEAEPHLAAAAEIYESRGATGLRIYGSVVADLERARNTGESPGEGTATDG